MRYSPYVSLLFAVLSILAFSQTNANLVDRKTVEVSTPTKPAAANRLADEAAGMELLKTAEAEATAFSSEMRAWVFWQIGVGYQTIDRGKALELFEMAFITACVGREDRSTAKLPNDPLARITGRPSLSPRLRLQADIARSIVLLEPKRADQILQQVDPAARTTVLVSLLSHQEKEQQFAQAFETLNRITAQDEMPYENAMRLMDTLKPEQSGELMQLFLAALASYRDHAPHEQTRDTFPIMLSRYWKRLPKEIARQAVDEIVKQADDGNKKGNYAVSPGKGTAALGSLYGYRLFQIMPVLRELDPLAAREYVEKYPALASSAGNNGTMESPASQRTPSEAAPLPAVGGASFRPSGNYRSLMTSMAELPSAQKAAAKADNGHADEAMSEATSIADLNLRAQAYEYIARVTSKKQSIIAASAIESMLRVAQKLQPSEGLRYYGSAAEIYMQVGRVDDAKKSIEGGLGVADKLYQMDSDDDDPNTALKAFWPSTNAYCTMLRQAARVSHTWATSLLQGIKDPEVKVAAETALAGGWLNAPIGPSTMMTTKKSSNSLTLSGRE